MDKVSQHHAPHDYPDIVLQPDPWYHRRIAGLHGSVRRDARRAGLRQLVPRAPHLSAGVLLPAPGLRRDPGVDLPGHCPFTHDGQLRPFTQVGVLPRGSVAMATIPDRRVRSVTGVRTRSRTNVRKLLRPVVLYPLTTALGILFL